MKYVLEHNYICFNTGPSNQRTQHYFHQIQGTAMGTPAAVALANIYMFMLEYPLLIKYRSEIGLYKRFLDDVKSVFKNRTTSQAFRDEMNAIRPRIKLKWTLSNHSVEFLDLVIHKDPQFAKTGKLTVSIHQKCMNTYLYIPAKSFHPRKTLQNFIINELQRYIRNCSRYDDFIKIKREFYNRLHLRGYSSKELADLFDIKKTPSINYNNRPRLIAPSKKTKQHHSIINNNNDPSSFIVCCKQGSCDKSKEEKEKEIITLVIPSTPHSQAIPINKLLHEQIEKTIKEKPSLAPIIGNLQPIVSYTKPRTLQQALCNNSK
jgi:hypothetical protein